MLKNTIHNTARVTNLYEFHLEIVYVFTEMNKAYKNGDLAYADELYEEWVKMEAIFKAIN